MTNENKTKQTDHFVQWFRDVAPYVHTHRGKTMVLQISGELIESGQFESTIHDIALLNSLGIKLIIVFGARPQIERKLSKRSIESRYINGLRVTDEISLSCIQEAVGAIRLKLEAMLSLGLPNSPMAGARIQVSSGNYVTAKPFGVIDGQDLEYTGSVRRIDADVINRQTSQGEIVIIPPVGYSSTGELFNLSSLAVATHTAVSLAADKLIFMFPYEGLKDKDGNDIQQLTQEEASTLVETDDKLTISPYTQISYAIGACSHGVGRVHLIDQNTGGGLLLELFSRDGIGTMISSLPFDDIRPATINDIAGILELIQPQEKQGSLVERSRERMELAINDYTVIVRDGTVIACSALHVYPDANVAELACLVVHDDYRHQNKGQMLFEVLERDASKNKIKKLFILTTQAEHWFMERGFVECKVDDLPMEKQSLYNYSRNSKVLMKEISS